MNNECKLAFNKAKELIESNIKKYGNELIPEVQEFDYGNIQIQYFINWEYSKDKNRIRKFNNVDNDKKNITKLIFFKEKSIFKIEDQNFDRTYIILNGEIDIKIQDNINKSVKSYDTVTIPKGVSHVGTVIRDTYVIVNKY